MTKRRAIRLLAPITVGTALVGVSFLVGGDEGEPFRSWSEEEPAHLPEIARKAAEKQRAPRPILAQLNPPIADHTQAPLVRRASQQSAPPQISAQSAAPERSARTRARLSASDTAMAGRLAEQVKLFDPATPLLPPEYRPAAAAPVSQDLASAAPIVDAPIPDVPVTEAPIFAAVDVEQGQAIGAGNHALPQPSFGLAEASTIETVDRAEITPPLPVLAGTSVGFEGASGAAGEAGGAPAGAIAAPDMPAALVLGAAEELAPAASAHSAQSMENTALSASFEQAFAPMAEDENSGAAPPLLAASPVSEVLAEQTGFAAAPAPDFSSAGPAETSAPASQPLVPEVAASEDEDQQGAALVAGSMSIGPMSIGAMATAPQPPEPQSFTPLPAASDAPALQPPESAPQAVAPQTLASQMPAPQEPAPLFALPHSETPAQAAAALPVEALASISAPPPSATLTAPVVEHSAFRPLSVDELSAQVRAEAEQLAFAEATRDAASYAASPAAPLPAIDASGLAANSVQGTDFSPGRQVFPAAEDAPELSYDDELILQIRVAGFSATDTIIAYGTREGIYLPFGELVRILDLAIRVSDDGNYASGWFLSEDRTLTIDLRQQILTIDGVEQPLPRGMAQAFDGELYLRAEAYSMLLPLDIEPSLRTQSVTLTTREPFPFEERMRREAERARLNSRQNLPEEEGWPREETPWLALSVPMADIEMRAVADSSMGERLEGDVRLAGDLAFMTAQGFFSATTRDGLVASLVELGRRDSDGDLLGPLRATEFQIGDVATTPMAMGLRGTAGRGAYVTNQAFETVSVFDQIDLRGVLPDGYEVELYRNDVLLGSTREIVNGQYEFLQIPVDYGLNIFRLIFYGPQGQRREEVRRISVGDGRLSPGQLQYSFGTVQRGVNLLGVQGPDFRPVNRYGNWQAVGELAYGFNTKVTGVFGAAFYEEEGRNRWTATAGARTGIGGIALRGDLGVSDGGGHAIGVGLGGKALGGAFTVSHFEYDGGFFDEVRSIGGTGLRRATDGDFNTSINIGGGEAGTYLPITARLRRVEFEDGRTRTNATLRGSARLASMILSNTVEYLRSTASGGIGFSQLIGNFDLATFNRSSTQLRGSVGYRAFPDAAITQVAAEVGHRVDDHTVINASSSYSFESDDVNVGLSASREFERFTVALDGQYGFGQGSYGIALRLGFSLGRDPLRQRVFMARPGQASSGSAALRAFQDMDGDGVFGEGDMALPEVDFAVFNNTARTDENGMARLGELGNGNRVTVQADPSTFPDILMAPVNRGIEIVPRAGRFHVSDYPIVALSEVEGTVSFAGDANQRGVSGLRLQLRRVGEDGEAENLVRTERGGYFFFEEVKPGAYDLIIDPEQGANLGICRSDMDPVVVGPAGDIISRNFTVFACDPPETAGARAANSES